ncbi:bifunctional lysine-specific demethylase and histidyl-hydroxylase NO66-like [Drosophila sulfurigaster albostrigata]|uniref:bifunctional lysine-specific demethylase and histidyl-hydroxylase NO66-like n=1 Tax=Drosophila sulfurigaster albostrigata TaxID=89887 RepID=UPI002D21B4CC|nr:bifunctional lysine-specific demethylase and histidyl-hydroxylase NO66-like [Drosophila sulfurigaster albostrigata]
MAEISAYQIPDAEKPSPAKKQQQNNAALSPKNAPKHTANHNGEIKENGGAKQNGVAKSPKAVQKMTVASPKKVLKPNGSGKKTANSNLNESQRKKKQMSDDDSNDCGDITVDLTINDVDSNDTINDDDDVDDDYDDDYDYDDYGDDDDDDEVESPAVAPPKAGRRSQDANNNVEKPAITAVVKPKETLLGRRQHDEGEATKADETGNSQPKQRRVGHLDEPVCDEVHLQDSVEEGKRALSWLMNPIEPQKFFQGYWEQNPCRVVRRKANYFSHLMSFPMIEEMLLKNHLEFTTNIDISSYKNDKRKIHNPDGRAMPLTVWSYYSNGYSVRFLNPSTYLEKLRALCTRLQEFFYCLVGANAYLTPPNSQGCAPHYDDIETFVLQVEGRKRWRLYMPPCPSDILARVSSGNYSQKDLGAPTLDVVLQPGDILYFPRGTVHQAVTEEQQHSLHITLSVYQQSYANLVEKLMPSVMARAIRQHLNLHRGLPLETWRHLGYAAGCQMSEERDKLLGDITKLVQTYLLPSAEQIDAAVDQLAKRFQHEALPPIVQEEEKARTVFGSVSEIDKQGNRQPDYNLTGSTEVRLLRANILRLIEEGTVFRIYYYLDNALEYCKFDASYMEIQPDEAMAVEALIKAYPKYTSVKELPLCPQDRRIELATALWERGLLMTKEPFK